MATVVNDYFMLKPDWANIVSLKRKWHTSLQIGLTNREKRSAILSWPRRTLSYSVSAVKYSDMAYVKKKLHRNIPNIWGCPIWPNEMHLTSAALVADSTFQVDSTEYMDLEIGGEFTIMTDKDTYEILTVDSFTGTTITSVENCLYAWGINAKVYPILKARIRSSQKFGNMTNRMSEIQMEFMEEFDQGITRNTPSISHYPTFRDYPVLNTPPNWANELIGDQWHNSDLLQYYGLATSWTHQDNTEIKFEAVYMPDEKQVIKRLTDFFDYHKGRWGAFWRPSWVDDLKITDAISSSDVTLTIEDIDFDDYWLYTKGGTWMIMLFPDGTQIEMGVLRATGTTITFNKPIGKDVSLAELPGIKICFLNLCRFNQDELEVQYVTDSLGDIQMNFNTISQEAPSPTTTSTTTTTTSSTTTTTSTTSSTTSTTSSSSTTTSTSSSTSTTTSSTTVTGSTSTTSTTHTYTASTTSTSSTTVTGSTTTSSSTTSTSSTTVTGSTTSTSSSTSTSTSTTSTTGLPGNMLVEVTIPASSVDSTLSNYPLYVDLSDMPDPFFSVVTSDGGDIRCYSDISKTTEIAREVVTIDTSAKTGQLHMKVPSVSSSTDTKVYVYVDGLGTEPATNATYGRDAVWADYAAVFHMEQRRPTSVDDDFTGDNGDPPDPVLWRSAGHDLETTGYSVEINNNKLRATVPNDSNDFTSEIRSNFILSGNFDIQIDYAKVSSDAPSSGRSYPASLVLTDFVSWIGIRLTHETDDSQDVWVGGTGVLTDTGAGETFTSGKFRIKRSGSDFTLWYWNGSDWTWKGSAGGKIYSGSSIGSNDVDVRIECNGDIDGGSVTDFDNFTITTGTIEWPPVAIDSTGNHNHGVSAGSNMTESDMVTAQIGDGFDLDGSNDTFDCDNLNTLDNLFAGGGTFQCWFDCDVLSFNRIYHKANSSSLEGHFIGLRTSDPYIQFQQDFTTSFGRWRMDGEYVSAGTTYKLDLTYNSDSDTNNPLFYLDGVNRSATESDTPSGSAEDDSDHELSLGANKVGSGAYFDGVLDEIRFREDILSADWIDVEFQNQDNPSSFYSVKDVALISTTTTTTTTSTTSTTASTSTTSTSTTSTSTTVAGITGLYAITIPSSKVDSTLSNYPLYVDLSDMPDSFYDIVTEDGGDIRCYSDASLTTELAREVVTLDTTAKTGELHIKVPSVSSSADTTVYVFVNGLDTEPAVTATYGRNAVWSNYAVVCHMEPVFPETDDDFTGTNGDAPDSDRWASDGDVDIQANKLFTTTGGASLYGSVLSNFVLSGDFDIRVDWEMPTMTTTEKWYTFMVVADSSGRYNRINREYISGLNRYRHASYNGTTWYTEGSAVTTSDESGKFRIVRTSGVVSVYYWGGSSWTLLSTASSWNTTTNVTVQLACISTVTQTVEANFDNFEVYSGTPVWDLPELLDSTGNGNDGASSGTMNSYDIVAAKIENGIDFDGTDDYISFGSDSSLDVSTGVAQAWINLDTMPSSDYYAILGKDNAGTNPYDFVIGVDDALGDVTDNHLFGRVSNGSGVGTFLETISPVSALTDYKVDVKFGTGGCALYLNGALQDSASETGGLSNSSANLTASTLYGSSRYLDGVIDEIRVCTQALSADWISTEYDNQNDPSNFYSIVDMNATTTTTV